MGIDIHVYITKYNREKRAYDEIDLYAHDCRVSPFDERNYELFDILSEVPSLPIDTKIIVYGEVLFDYRNATEPNREEGYYGYGFRQINLADLLYFYVTDYDYEEKDYLGPFIEDIKNYIKIADRDSYQVESLPSLYNIIYWFDN